MDRSEERKYIHGHDDYELVEDLQRFIDDLEVSDVRPFEKALYAYVESSNPQLFRTIEEKKALDDAIKADMTKTIKEAKERFLADRKTAKAKA